MPVTSRSSPTISLLWEVWQRRRSTISAIGVFTVAGRLLDFFDDGQEPSPLVVLLAMGAFLMLLGVFNYTDASSGRGLGRFPERLFTLPVTTLRLVTIPVLAGIASIELLYLIWMEPMARGGSTSAAFVAVLLAALMVFYVWALWVLERAGSLRLITLGVIVITLFLVGLLPSFAPTPPPSWRSEIVLSGLVATLAFVAFLLTWSHVARLRAGGGGRAHRDDSLLQRIAGALPGRRRSFASASAAQFWFEWRSGGMVLPSLVTGILLAGIAPMSWLARNSAGGTFQLVLVALAVPIVLAIPIGIAFSKPKFWSEDMSVPPFVGLRPLSSEELVAIKVRVAAVSVIASWLVLLIFLSVWLPVWGNLDTLSLLAIQIWAFHEQSIAAVIAIAVLVAVAGMFLTWRFLVSRLWSGLSGMRAWLVRSVVLLIVIVIASLLFEADRLPGWLLEDPSRIGPVVWIAAAAVVAKYWLAAYAWRSVTPNYFRVYLSIWLAGTAVWLSLGVIVGGMMRIYLPLDVDRARSLVILVSLLAVPLARVGLAPSSLERNRHRP